MVCRLEIVPIPKEDAQEFSRQIRYKKSKYAKDLVRLKDMMAENEWVRIRGFNSVREGKGLSDTIRYHFPKYVVKFRKYDEGREINPSVFVTKKPIGGQLNK